ncbi:MAG TPA: hypothetical protein DCS07_02620 [Bdellovibrionales bacterium]|nr:hypothetical protein [Bdellovibrionales bacterium]
MQFGGFRIQDRPEVLNKDLSPMNGGHPDGIGGAVPDAGVEIVGLTGERVPETFKAMENILRNIQAKGGVRMVIQGTETGQPILDLIALARLLLSGSDIPDLDYNLIDVRSDSSAPRTGSPESLMEEAIVLTSILNHANPGLREYAQLIKNSYERWLQSRSSKSVQELFTSEAEFQPELDRILDLAPDLWPKVVDLQTTLLQLKKSLHRI